MWDLEADVSSEKLGNGDLSWQSYCDMSPSEDDPKHTFADAIGIHQYTVGPLMRRDAVTTFLYLTKEVGRPSITHRALQGDGGDGERMERCCFPRRSQAPLTKQTGQDNAGIAFSREKIR